MTTFALFGAIVLIAVILAIIVFYPAMRDDAQPGFIKDGD